MRISEQGRITIPKALSDRYGMNHNAVVEIIPAENGLLIRKRTTAEHPVGRIAGILEDSFEGAVDEYIEELRGR